MHVHVALDTIATFGTPESILIIEVSLLQGVLIRELGFHCTCVIVRHCCCCCCCCHLCSFSLSHQLFILVKLNQLNT